MIIFLVPKQELGDKRKYVEVNGLFQRSWWAVPTLHFLLGGRLILALVALAKQSLAPEGRSQAGAWEREI